MYFFWSVEDNKYLMIEFKGNSEFFYLIFLIFSSDEWLWLMYVESKMSLFEIFVSC